MLSFCSSSLRKSSAILLASATFFSKSFALVLFSDSVSCCMIFTFSSSSFAWFSFSVSFVLSSFTIFFISLVLLSIRLETRASSDCLSASNCLSFSSKSFKCFSASAFRCFSSSATFCSAFLEFSDISPIFVWCIFLNLANIFWCSSCFSWRRLLCCWIISAILAYQKKET